MLSQELSFHPASLWQADVHDQCPVHAQQNDMRMATITKPLMMHYCLTVTLTVWRVAYLQSTSLVNCTNASKYKTSMVQHHTKWIHTHRPVIKNIDSPGEMYMWQSYFLLMIKLLLFYEFTLQQPKTKLKFDKYDCINSTPLNRGSENNSAFGTVISIVVFSFQNIGDPATRTKVSV